MTIKGKREASICSIPSRQSDKSPLCDHDSAQFSEVAWWFPIISSLSKQHGPCPLPLLFSQFRHSPTVPGEIPSACLPGEQEALSTINSSPNEQCDNLCLSLLHLILRFYSLQSHCRLLTQRPRLDFSNICHHYDTTTKAFVPGEKAKQISKYANILR